MGHTGEIRIKLTAEEAEELLSRLPGGRELYLEIAQQFIEAYEAPSEKEVEPE